MTRKTARRHVKREEKRPAKKKCDDESPDDDQPEEELVTKDMGGMESADINPFGEEDAYRWHRTP